VLGLPRTDRLTPAKTAKLDNILRLAALKTDPAKLVHGLKGRYD
jgi:hypothetical protein